MDLISVIVPIYNVEKYLKKSIESIINQTYKNIDILLVDDGSKDKYGEICDTYMEKDSRIKVIHQENMGQSIARNKGIEKSTGEYIIFVDSDDYIYEEYIDILYNLLKENNADISACGYEYFYEDKVSEKFVNTDKKKLQNREELLISMNTVLGEMYVVVWGKLYKKELFNGIEFPNMKISEDYVVLYKLYSKIKKAVITENKMYYYFRNNSESLTYKLKEDFYVNNFKVLDREKEFLLEKELPKAIPYVMKTKLYWIIEYYTNYKSKLSNAEKKDIIREYRKTYKDIKGIKLSKMYKIFNIFPNIYIILKGKR